MNLRLLRRAGASNLRRFGCALALALAALAPALAGPASAVAAPAREWLYLNGIGNVFVLDADTLEPVHTLKCKGMTQGVTADEADEKLYVVSGQRELLEVFDRATGKPLRTYSFSEPGRAKAHIYGFAIMKDRMYAYLNTTRFDGYEPGKQDRFHLAEPEIVGVDLKTGKRLGRIKMPLGVLNIQPFGTDGSKLLAVGRNLWVVDVKTWQATMIEPLETPRMEGEGRIVAYAEWVHPETAAGLGAYPYWSTDPIVGRTMAGLMTIDAVRGVVDHFEIGPPVANQFPFSAMVTPDRKRAFMTMNKLYEVDMAKRRVTRTRDYGTTFYAISGSADGKRLFLSSSGASLAVVDSGSLDITRRIELPAEIWDVTVMPAKPQGPPAGERSPR